MLHLPTKNIPIVSRITCNLQIAYFNFVFFDSFVLLSRFSLWFVFFFLIPQLLHLPRFHVCITRPKQIMVVDSPTHHLSLFDLLPLLSSFVVVRRRHSFALFAVHHRCFITKPLIITLLWSGFYHRTSDRPSS